MSNTFVHLTIFGVCIMYQFTGSNYLNGYFASWIGFFTAAYLLFLVSASAQSAVGMARSSASLGACLLASFIVLAQAGTLCDSDYCPEYTQYAIALGCISAFFCVLLFLGDKFPDLAKAKVEAKTLSYHGNLV
jgi:hypothetical protein